MAGDDDRVAEGKGGRETAGTSDQKTKDMGGREDAGTSDRKEEDMSGRQNQGDDDRERAVSLLLLLTRTEFTDEEKDPGQGGYAPHLTDGSSSPTWL